MPRDHSHARPLRRGDLARATGCHLETIRYYEGIGLLPDPPRSRAGHRQYGTDQVERLTFIMRARDLGFSLEEVRSLLTLMDDGTRTCATVKGLAERHLAAVRAKIEDLRGIERALSRAVARCTGDAKPDCAVLDALQRERP